jgi:hypothetical protein
LSTSDESESKREKETSSKNEVVYVCYVSRKELKERKILAIEREKVKDINYTFLRRRFGSHVGFGQETILKTRRGSRVHDQLQPLPTGRRGSVNLTQANKDGKGAGGSSSRTASKTGRGGRRKKGKGDKKEAKVESGLNQNTNEAGNGISIVINEYNEEENKSRRRVGAMLEVEPWPNKFNDTENLIMKHSALDEHFCQIDNLRSSFLNDKTFLESCKSSPVPIFVLSPAQSESTIPEVLISESTSPDFRESSETLELSPSVSSEQTADGSADDSSTPRRRNAFGLLSAVLSLRSNPLFNSSSNSSTGSAGSAGLLSPDSAEAEEEDDVFSDEEDERRRSKFFSFER